MTLSTQSKSSKAKVKSCAAALALALAVTASMTACANDGNETAPQTGGNDTNITNPANGEGSGNDAPTNTPEPDSGANNENGAGQNGDAGPSDDQSGETGGGEEPTNGDGESPGEGTPSETDGTPIIAAGTYSGLVDGHTVEIVTPEGPTAFQYGDELADTLGELAQDDPVAITYTEKEVQAGDETVTQLWLTAIEKTE
ncbi:hypothetical protein IDH44_03785 [Paenibacillus sp. IB182496]|uniref:DUF5666 domain-containing protein n=1 Tax=Paenibacillus sabuli TaxID=2772509 RepID=A0A927BRP7_9BACL|nr:hypothetical protein [Paenibacillus sabuli]MBD2844299.1 hypothetical protein [Paenibacillus sabuli]